MTHRRRNMGKKSLYELELELSGLHLGMKVPADVLER